MGENTKNYRDENAQYFNAYFNTGVTYGLKEDVSVLRKNYKTFLTY